MSLLFAKITATAFDSVTVYGHSWFMSNGMAYLFLAQSDMALFNFLLARVPFTILYVKYL